jgi:hypothetical protein
VYNIDGPKIKESEVTDSFEQDEGQQTSHVECVALLVKCGTDNGNQT